MTVMPFTYVEFQARDTVRLASKIDIPAADSGMTEEEVGYQFHFRIPVESVVISTSDSQNIVFD